MDADDSDDEKIEGKSEQKSSRASTPIANASASNEKSKKGRRGKDPLTQDAKLMMVGWAAAPRGVLGIVFEMLGSQQAYVLDIVCRKWTRAVRKMMDATNRWIQQRLTIDLQDFSTALDKMVKERRPWQMAVNLLV